MSATSPLAVHDLLLPLATGESRAARLYRRRAGASDAAADPGLSAPPLVLHFHGGAFVGGDLGTGACVATLLAEAGAVVVSIDYPLAPSAPFPAAVETGHAALCALARQRRRWAHAASPVYVAGEEAGGNLAAGVALRHRDAGGPALAGQLLFSPMLDACTATASLRAAGAGLPSCRLARGWREYLSRPDDALHPYAAPARALRLAGLPPALIVTADDDPMRDEAAEWVARLLAAGVDARCVRLVEPTGWPSSFDERATDGAPWQAAVLAPLQRFFAATRPPRPSAARTSAPPSALSETPALSKTPAISDPFAIADPSCASSSSSTFPGTLHD